VGLKNLDRVRCLSRESCGASVLVDEAAEYVGSLDGGVAETVADTDLRTRHRRVLVETARWCRL